MDKTLKITLILFLIRLFLHPWDQVLHPMLENEISENSFIIINNSPPVMPVFQSSGVRSDFEPRLWRYAEWRPGVDDQIPAAAPGILSTTPAQLDAGSFVPIQISSPDVLGTCLRDQVLPAILSNEPTTHRHLKS
ncbi:hypothetical protein L0128_19355 [candidate division KSB1 bacterium]|nr:hypothetical protein [candidate division KSB1 bacterium]